MTQLKVVNRRNNNALWRAPDYQFTKLFNHSAIALLTGLTFLQVGNSTADLQYRVFGIFIASILPALIIFQIEPSFIMARDIYIREASSKMYSELVFGAVQFIGELPYSLLCATFYYLLWYYPNGFNYHPSRAGYAFLMILVVRSPFLSGEGLDR